MAILDKQQRYSELGRIRIGDKDERGFPSRLDTFRLTSFSLDLLRAASGRWGGIPQEWAGAPTEGKQYELITESEVLEVYVPRQDVDSRQYYELYSKGGAQRRCDGVTELISNRPCKCDANERECSPTTHVLFMLPQIPGVGVWRLTSRGWGVATEMPGTVNLLNRLAGEGVMPAATLAIETRTSVSEGQTHHFNVPVIRLPYPLAELEEAGHSMLVGGPARKPPLAGPRPVLPVDASFAGDSYGDVPALPQGAAGDEMSGTDVLSAEDSAISATDSPVASVPDPTLEGGEVHQGEGTEPPSDVQRDAQLSYLLGLLNGSLTRAATYTNKANGTSYTKTSIGNASFDELEKAVFEVEGRVG